MKKRSCDTVCVVGDDFYDFICTVEMSLGIVFHKQDNVVFRNLGDIIELSLSKLSGKNSQECTSQQAFYKLRQAIRLTKRQNLFIERATRLSDLFPQKLRRKEIKEIENRLSVSLGVLSINDWVASVLAVFFLLSTALCFANMLYGILTFGLTVAGCWGAGRLKNELIDMTIEELVRKMVRENYKRCRRDEKTFNAVEVEKIIVEIFAEVCCADLNITSNMLSRETKFV
jgi:hypothetical protein